VSRKQVRLDRRLSSAARQALQRDTVYAVRADPTAAETARSYERAWRNGLIRWSEIPVQFRPEV
jgi:hypothetical protein